jgi:hypothetical protein
MNIKDTVNTIQENYKTVMTNFLSNYTKKLREFKEYLTNTIKVKIEDNITLVNGMQTHMSKSDYTINSTNLSDRTKLWETLVNKDKYKQMCDGLNTFDLSIDVSYQKLLDAYKKDENELPMCRSNIMQSASSLLRPVGTIGKYGKKFIKGTAVFIIAPILAPVAIAGVVLVIIPIGKTIGCMASGCKGGSRKKSKKYSIFNKKRHNTKRKYRK